MLLRIKDNEDRIDPATLVQNVRWAPRTLEPSLV
jgi:hypothetical protein